MKKTTSVTIKDLALLRSWGSDVTLSVRTRKEIAPYEFEGASRDGICLSATFHGLCDHEPFSFTKTYAGGHNPGCVLASARALIIANTRLKRDYDTLEKSGVAIERVMFTAADEFPGMEKSILSKAEPDTMRRMIRLAGLGECVHAGLRLVYTPASGSATDARQLTALITFFHGNNAYQTKEIMGSISADSSETHDAITAANKKLEKVRGQLERAGIRVNRARFSPCECELERMNAYIPLDQAFEKKLLTVNN